MNAFGLFLGLVGFSLSLAAIILALTLAETPKAQPCTWGASSTAVLPSGRVVGPSTSGCIPR